jgi:hypothetical protein
MYAHGFGTHAAHYQSILALNDHYKDIIEHERYKPYFIYGSIFPDIQFATNYKASLQKLYQKIREIKIKDVISVIPDNAAAFEGLTYEINTDQIPDPDVTQYPFGINTHDDKYGMAFAEYLLQQCKPIEPPGPNPGSNGIDTAYDARNMKIAFAVGYYAHLAQDVAAHDFLVPKITSALNLGDIELIKNSGAFAEDPNSQTEGIIEGIIDHYYGDNTLVSDIVFNHIWVRRSQYEPTVIDATQLFYNGPIPTYYTDDNGYPELNPVLLFFYEVLNDWYNNNPFNLPISGEDAYRKSNLPMSATGLSQLTTMFRFVNRFYPAVAGHPFNGKDRFDEVLADWVSNHLNLSGTANAYGIALSTWTGGLLGLMGAIEIKVSLFPGLAYPGALEKISPDLVADARTLTTLMLSDIGYASELVAAHSDVVNVAEFNKLKNSILFSNPTSVLDSYWDEYKSLGTTIYNEIGPVDGEPSRWYNDWSPYHSQSMAWSALSSLNNLMPDIYTTNPNVAVYDAYFEVDGNRITGPQPTATFQNDPNVKVVVELYNVSNVTSQSITLKVKKDHNSADYNSDVLKTSTSFTLDHDPLTYNTTDRKKVELSFPVSLADLSGYDGYYFELVNNSNNKVMFSSSFEQYQERLELTPNYTRLYGTYDEGKWPVSLGLIQSVATVNLTSPQFPEGGSGAFYNINGINQNTITTSVDDYIHLEAVPPEGYIFYEWSDGNNENPRTYRVPFTSNNLYATFKGVHLSDNTDALSSGQRKLVQSGDGVLHIVYESIGKVWYEMSSDNGMTWTIMNGGQPLSTNESKNPFIYVGNYTSYITFQEKSGSNSNIKVQVFTYLSDIMRYEENISLPNNYSHDANPVLYRSSYQNYLDGYPCTILIYSRLTEPFYPGGLVVYVGVDSPGSYDIGFDSENLPYNEVIPYTDDNSRNVTITNAITGEYPLYPYNHYNGNYFHIAWEQNITSSSSVLKYQRLLFNGNIVYEPTVPDEPSLGVGYTKNFSPSLVVMTDNLPRLTWVGEKEVEEQEEEQRKIGSTEGGGIIEKKVILRGRNSSDWNSSFWKYGNEPNSVSMNYNESGTIGGYAFAWSEGSPTITGHKSVANTRINWSPVNVNGAAGKDIHLSNGDALEDMYTMGLDAAALPYELVLSDHLTEDAQSGGQGELKVAANTIQSVGREGLINYNESVFFFEVNDIMLDGEVIEFEPLSDTTNFNDLISLNSYLESLPFEVDNSSQLAYSVKYGLVSEEEQVLEEGEFINYKVQLVDNVTREVIGTYDNITFTENNLEPYNNIDYIIMTNGIGNRMVKMRLVVDYNVEADPNLATIFSEIDLLQKNGAVTLNYNGEGEVTTYDLSQNYPNPFNPTTTIKYQIPNSGNVSLKIYDVLGAEVMTLVNTTQAQGRYEVKFDASQLSSGVYIYRIQANDYIASRKMMLLK